MNRRKADLVIRVDKRSLIILKWVKVILSSNLISSWVISKRLDAILKHSEFKFHMSADMLKKTMKTEHHWVAEISQCTWHWRKWHRLRGSQKSLKNEWIRLGNDNKLWNQTAWTDVKSTVNCSHHNKRWKY